MNIKTTLLLILILVSQKSFSQKNWIDKIAYGEYTVGFKTVELQDHSRPYKIKGISSFVSRPMQIGIWYPAKLTNNKKKVNFNYYQLLATTQESLEKINITDKKDEALDIEMSAYLNADAKTGSFPLIIYASAQNASGYDNSLVCEQLASYGYIVVTVASKGYYSKQMPFNAEGAEAQTRDLEFLYGFMHDFPNVDINRLGMFGFSFGGLNMINFSLKNLQVKAMVSFDGSIFSPLGYDILKSHNYLDVKNFNADFLGFLGNKSFINKIPLFDDVTLSDIHLIKVKDLNHLDFSSANLMMNNRPIKIKETFIDMANLTVKFMNKSFKKDISFNQAIQNYNKEYYTEIKEKTSIGSPKVKKSEYINYINEKGIDQGIEIYKETKKDFPDYILFDYQPFRDIGFIKMMKKDFNNAIKVFKVLIKEYPDNPDSYRRLGEAYMENKQYFKARELIKKGLKLDPDSPAMNDILRIINERDNGK